MSKFKSFLLLNFLFALLVFIVVGAVQAEAFSDNFNTCDMSQWSLSSGWSCTNAPQTFNGTNYTLSYLYITSGGSGNTATHTGLLGTETYFEVTMRGNYSFVSAETGTIGSTSFQFLNNGTSYITATIAKHGAISTTGFSDFAGTEKQWYRLVFTLTGTTLRRQIYNITGIQVNDASATITVPTNPDRIVLYTFANAAAYGTSTLSSSYDNVVASETVAVGDVNFNATSYKNYNTAQITYVLNSPDFGTYDYKLETINVATLEVKNSWTLSSSSGSVTQSLANYGSASYYAMLSRKLKSESWSSSNYVDYDIATVTAVVYLQGTSYNAENSTVLPSVNVNTLQSGTWKNTTSNTAGNYSLYDYTENIAITMNASKTNFTHVNYSWTPLSNVLYTQNLYLFPNNLTRSSGGVQGVVMDDRLYQGISGASVTIANASWNTSVTSNSIGYYNFSDLVNGTYNITASKTGLAEQVTYSINVTNQTSWIIQNILLSLKYTLTVSTQDASTTVPLTEFTTCILGNCTATTNGSTIYKLYYGVYYISASATGYYANGKTIILTADTTETIQLTKTPTSYPIYQGTPHNVKFIVQDVNGIRKSGVNVTAQGYGTTLGDWAWLKGLLGIDYSTYPLQNTSMSGFTGTDGSITFLMVETINYKIDFVNASAGIEHTEWIYPKDGEYVITVGTLTYAMVNVTPYANVSTYNVTYTGKAWSVQNYTSEYLNSSIGLGTMGQGITTGIVLWVFVGAGGALTTILASGILVFLGVLSEVTLLFFILTAISMWILTRT